MTAKPESVGSVVFDMKTVARENIYVGPPVVVHGTELPPETASHSEQVLHLRRALTKFADRILTAHRAELAEALKEPTEQEIALSLAGPRWEVLRDGYASRRKKHGVGE